MNINISFISIIIPIICTISTSIIVFLTYKNNTYKKNTEEITDRVKRDTAISTKLDMVIAGTTELKNEIKNLDNKFDDITERVTKCEESIKHAHDKIKKMEYKMDEVI
jgi:peptidoglycan hydrolase CwlO-like protein